MICRLRVTIYSVDYATDELIGKTVRQWARWSISVLNDVANYLILVSEFAESTVLTIAHRLRTVIDYDRVSVLTFLRFRKTKKRYKQVMVLEQGKIIEFDRYGQQVSNSNDEITNLLLCPQACHLVEKFDIPFPFVVQSNGKRGICNIKKISWSLNSSVKISNMSLSPCSP